MCTKVPRKVGKIALSYFLNDLGNIKGEATLVTKADGTVLYGSAAASEHHDMDWLSDHLPEDGSVKITSLTNSHDVLIIAGPNSRAFLKLISPQSVKYPPMEGKQFRYIIIIKSNAPSRILIDGKCGKKSFPTKQHNKIKSSISMLSISISP